MKMPRKSNKTKKASFNSSQSKIIYRNFNIKLKWSIPIEVNASEANKKKIN